MIKTIDGAAFSRMMLSAAAEIDLNKQKVNELNVFPVPDGDTGTNMSLTIQTAAQELKKIEPATVDQAASVTASAKVGWGRRTARSCRLVSPFTTAVVSSAIRSVALGHMSWAPRRTSVSAWNTSFTKLRSAPSITALALLFITYFPVTVGMFRTLASSAVTPAQAISGSV